MTSPLAMTKYPADLVHGLRLTVRQALASARLVLKDSNVGKQGIEASPCLWTERTEICREASTTCTSPNPPAARRHARSSAGLAPLLCLVRWRVAGGNRRTEPGLLALRPLTPGTGEKKTRPGPGQSLELARSRLVVVGKSRCRGGWANAARSWSLDQ